MEDVAESRSDQELRRRVVAYRAGSSASSEYGSARPVRWTAIHRGEWARRWPGGVPEPLPPGLAAGPTTRIRPPAA